MKASITLLLLLCLYCSGFSQFKYERAEVFDLGVYMGGFGYSDLNNDGYSDLVSHFNNQNFLSVVINNPDGDFYPPFRLELDYYSVNRDLSLADVNNDSYIDIVITDMDNRQVGVLLNNNNLNFSPVAYYAVNGHPQAIHIDDLNGDELMDIAVVNSSPDQQHTLTIMYSDGLSGFAKAEYVISNPSHLTGADFDNDGDVDLIVSNKNTGIEIFQNDSIFNHIGSITTSENAKNLQVGDMNNDGFPDVAYVNSFHQGFFILYGNNDLTFTDEKFISTENHLSYNDFIVNDINYDGFTDFVFGTANVRKSVFMLGNSDNTYTQIISDLNNTGGSAYKGFYFTDLKKTGNKGILNMNFTGRYTFENQFDSTFKFTSSSLRIPMWHDLNDIKPGDIDNDGIIDLVICNYQKKFISVYKGEGNLSFKFWKNIIIEFRATSVELEDMNNDGFPDIYTSDSGNSGGELLYNDGLGNFTSVLKVPLSRNFGIGDFNNDGLKDIIIDNEVYGNFGSGVFKPVNNQFRFNMFDISVTDINYDGFLDLIFSYSSNFKPDIYYGSGDFNFHYRSILNVGSNYKYINSADFNLDGFTDISLHNFNDTTIIFYGNEYDNGIKYYTPGFDEPKVFDIDKNDTLDIVYPSENGLAYYYIGNNGKLKEGFLKSVSDNSRIRNLTSGYYINDSTLGVAFLNSYNKLEIHSEKIIATISFSNLQQNYTGKPAENPVVILPAGVSHTVTYSKNESPPVDAGNYLITVSVDDPDYKGIATDTLRILKIPLIVKADSIIKIYGEDNPRIELRYNGFVSDDGEIDLDEKPYASTSAQTYSDVGDYGIMISGGKDNNYYFEKINGNLKIKKRSLVIKAEDKNITYGDQMPALTLTFTGFVNEDTSADLDMLPSVSSHSGEGSAGTYAINLEGGNDNNYEFLLEDGRLKINKAPLTFDAGNYEILVGEPLPDVEYAVSGFVNDEDVSVIDELPVIVLDVTDSFVPGEYVVTLTGGSDNNYEIILINGKLYINIATGIRKEPSEITVYPNPAEDYLKIHDPFGKVSSITIMDSKGQIIMKSKIIDPINIAHLDKQIYLVLLNFADGTYKVVKLIIN